MVTAPVLARPLPDLEFTDPDGYVWRQDPYMETWACRDYDDSARDVTTEWLAEHRGLVTA